MKSGYSRRSAIRSMPFVAALLFLSGCGFEKEQQAVEAEKIRGPSAVLFSIDGAMPQFSGSMGIFSSLQQSQYQLEKLLARAASDPMVQEIAVHIGSPVVSFARAEEIAKALARAASSGKPLVCHIDSAENLSYWIAARGCPRILISPAGGVEAVGLSLEAIYVKELLASLGVFADMISVGRYKDAVEPLVRDSMSPDTKMAMESLVFELGRLFYEGIAAGRRLDAAKVRDIIDNGPYDAATSVQLGLADEMSTLGQYLDLLRAKYAAGVVRDYGKKTSGGITLGELLKMFSGGEKETALQAPHVAVVSAIGPIISGEAGGGLMPGGMDVVSDMDLTEVLSEAARNSAVRAVVLRIDSPGGDAMASDNIWHAVRNLAAVKPVIASLGDVAASGGYYIASAATEIVGSPSTITGSIGVVGGKIVLSDAATKIGVKTERITAGKRAALSSPFTPFSQEERNTIETLMRRVYDLFADRVATGRRLDRSQVLAAAEGRVWTGSQAVALKLVDREGGLWDALDRARAVAGLPIGTPVEMLPKPKSFMEVIGETLAEPDSFALSVAGRNALAGRAMVLSSLLSKRKVLAYTPVLFDIR